MKRVLTNLVEGVSAVMVVALTLVVILQVFNRFVLQTPLAWSEDLAMLFFHWVAFLGAALGVKRVSHFGIELVVRTLPERVRHRVELIVPLIMAVVALTMITEGAKLVEINRNRFYSSMDVSYTWTFLSVPVGGALTLLYLAWHEVQRWRGERP